MEKIATFGGGCFWCMVKPFSKLEGIIKIESGYSGGHVINPTYEQVCTDTTGHIEVIQITYDEDIISYEDLLNIYWRQIDPTDEGGQFNDRGEKYKTVIFYHDENQKNIATKSKQELEDSNIFKSSIKTQIKEAMEFFKAEEYHQDYYKKNFMHYEMYFKGSGRHDFIKNNWDKNNKNRKELQNILTDIQFNVTQNDHTEKPFENEYHNSFYDGIYVDITNEEPLFSSKDKFDSRCGWPSFTKPINKNAVIEKSDFSHGMYRVEVRTNKSNYHLGHVFDDGPVESGGLRYCINSAAIKFIKKEEMAEKGYGNYLHEFN